MAVLAVFTGACDVCEPGTGQGKLPAPFQGCLPGDGDPSGTPG